jgi:hypothetical protein
LLHVQAIGHWPWGRWLVFSRLPQSIASSLAATSQSASADVAGDLPARHLATSAALALSPDGEAAVAGQTVQAGRDSADEAVFGDPDMAPGGSADVVPSADVAAICRLTPLEHTDSSPSMVLLAKLMYCPGVPVFNESWSLNK